MWNQPFPGAVGADALLHQARQALQAGALAVEDLLPPALAHVSRSWRRSVEAGLDAFALRSHPPQLSRPELARATEQQHEWLAHARPVMEYLLTQTRERQGMAVLADANGLLLDVMGDPHFLQRAARLSVAPGAYWLERHRGTNAIGTALAEAAPVMVHGLEHFLECHGFFSCAAAPVRGPDGQVLGVLDFSSDRRMPPSQVFGAVCAAAHMIENRLFLARHSQQLHLHFHPLAEGLGTLAEGVLAVDENGVLAGANAAALDLLALPAAQLGRATLHTVLQADMPALLRGARQVSALTVRTTAAPHRLLHVRVQPALAGPTRPASAKATTTPHAIADTSGPALPAALHELDTGDPAWRALLHKAHKVQDRAIALLLHGESGSGKEVLARAIHQASARASQPFVAVNCAALPEHLIEAELFGHAPGAFTGARREGAPGLIRQAHGGTLFLDEIGDMPLPLQTRLLRVLQERCVTPLGGGQPVAVDFALICATHRDLRAEVAAGRFRDDLYWRLNGLLLRLPPLRQRRDFDELAARILAQHAGWPAPALAPALAAALRAYAWPGNLRQLDSVLRTAVALAGDEPTIGWLHLPDDLVQELAQPLVPVDAAPAAAHSHGSAAPSAPVPQRLAQHTEQAMRHAVERAGGNLSQAARDLGIGRSTLYRHLHPKRRSAPRT